jgi:hypothetical protein
MDLSVPGGPTISILKNPVSAYLPTLSGLMTHDNEVPSLPSGIVHPNRIKLKSAGRFQPTIVSARLGILSDGLTAASARRMFISLYGEI